jgi:hypothetical protein
MKTVVLLITMLALAFTAYGEETPITGPIDPDGTLITVPPEILPPGYIEPPGILADDQSPIPVLADDQSPIPVRVIYNPATDTWMPYKVYDPATDTWSPYIATTEGGQSSQAMATENPTLQPYVDAGYTPSQIEFLGRE